MEKYFTRRRILSLTLAAGAAGSMASLPARETRAADASGKVSESDPVASALGYVSDATHVDAKANPMYQRGAACANCFWYAPEAKEAAGQCNYFPGKLVDAKAWCQMWHGRAK